MKIKIAIKRSKSKDSSKTKPMNIDMTEHAKTHSIPAIMRRDNKRNY